MGPAAVCAYLYLFVYATQRGRKNWKSNAIHTYIYIFFFFFLYLNKCNESGFKDRRPPTGQYYPLNSKHNPPHFTFFYSCTSSQPLGTFFDPFFFDLPLPPPFLGSASQQQDRCQHNEGGCPFLAGCRGVTIAHGRLGQRRAIQHCVMKEKRFWNTPVSLTSATFWS